MRAAPLRLRVEPSRLLAGVLALGHGTAFACATWFLPAWWMRALAGVALVSSLVFHVRRDALQLAGDAITEMQLHDAGRCELTLRNGTVLAGNLEDSTFVAPLLTIVNVRQHGRAGRRSVILVADSAPQQDRRQLRVWLRHRARSDARASGSL
ncbi:MAG TPA: protein YgfX [Burkholderiales bacterium]